MKAISLKIVIVLILGVFAQTAYAVDLEKQAAGGGLVFANQRFTVEDSIINQQPPETPVSPDPVAQPTEMPALDPAKVPIIDFGVVSHPLEVPLSTGNKLSAHRLWFLFSYKAVPSTVHGLSASGFSLNGVGRSRTTHPSGSRPRQYCHTVAPAPFYRGPENRWFPVESIWRRTMSAYRVMACDLRRASDSLAHDQGVFA